jgi:hypothetical protein
MELRAADYSRWVEIRDKINALGQSIYQLLSDIRKSAPEFKDGSLGPALTSEFVSKIDAVILGFGSSTFGDVVGRLRNVLIELDAILRNAA